MKKSEIFDELVEKICEICEVRKEVLLSGRKLQSVVDARILCVQYLRRIGFSSDDIAIIFIRKQVCDMGYCPPIRELKSKAKNIDRLFALYSDRCLQSYLFCLISVEIRDYCREKYAELYLAGMKELPER